MRICVTATILLCLQVVEGRFNEVMDTLLTDIAKNNMVGCFERLVCDISAAPASFGRNSPIVTGIQMSRGLDGLSPKAAKVSQRLVRAMEFGAELRDLTHCESVFNQCLWNGPQMDAVISKFNKVQ